MAYDDKYSQNVNLSAKLSAANPTIMKLMVYYKKMASSGGNRPLATLDIKDFLNNVYTISIVPSTKNNGDVVISIRSATNATLTNCVVLYPRKISDQGSLNLYFPAPTTNNAITIPSASLLGGFRFVFRFQISGDPTPGRQYLLPASAAQKSGHVCFYDDTNPTAPLSTVIIPNTI